MAMIRLSCPDCGRRFSVKSEYAGRKGKCKDCGRVFRIPAPEIVVDPDPVIEDRSGPTQPRPTPAKQSPLLLDPEKFLVPSENHAASLTLFGTIFVAGAGGLFGGLIGHGLGNTPLYTILGAGLLTGLFFLLRFFGVGRRR